MKTLRSSHLRRRTQRGFGKKDFPFKKGVKYSSLIVTPEGEYSMTKRKDGETLLRHMKSILKTTSDKTITDVTGNVGSDTVLFGLHFKHVHAIEIEDANFKALANNVKTFGLQNVTLHKGDSTKVYNWKTDVLYADPPWGGPGYKEKDKLDLYLGDTRVDEWLHDVLKQEWKPSYVFMKLPRNYNFDRLSDIPGLRIFSIRGFKLIGFSTLQ